MTKEERAAFHSIVLLSAERSKNKALLKGLCFWISHPGLLNLKRGPGLLIRRM
jgi:hypothetical protein